MRRLNRVRGLGGTECDHGTMHVGCAQRIERATTRLRRRHNDGLEGFTERSFDCRFPTAVDVDEVQQSAEHILDPGQVLRPCTSPGTLESEMQRLVTCTPSRCVVGRVLAGRVGRFVATFCGHPTSLRRCELGHQVRFDALGVTTLHAQTLRVGIETSHSLRQCI